MKNIFKVGNRSKNTYKDTKFFMKGRKSGLFGLLGQFLCPGSGFAFPILIWIRIKDRMNANPSGNGINLLDLQH